MADVGEWEANQEGFTYEPPEGPPESWSAEEYRELFDRVISREVTWHCGKCSKPLRSLEAARRHVENVHSESLVESAVSRQEQDDA